jgi:hypothetical protein
LYNEFHAKAIEIRTIARRCFFMKQLYNYLDQEIIFMCGFSMKIVFRSFIFVLALKCSSISMTRISIIFPCTDIDLLIENSRRHLFYDILLSLRLLYTIIREQCALKYVNTTRCMHECVRTAIWSLTLKINADAMVVGNDYIVVVRIFRRNMRMKFTCDCPLPLNRTANRAQITQGTQRSLLALVAREL